MDASLDQENVGAAVKKLPRAKAAPGEKLGRATKKGTVKPLQSSSAFNVGASDVPAVPALSNGKTIEEMYQKKSQLEHILLRPDTYVGSVEKHTQMLWVYEEGRMVQRAVTYVPGLYKIFDEILVNAADNKQRDPKMDSVKVDIDTEQGVISVFNSGDGVPVEIHQEEGVYVPEMIFGHLLTSSNYDDSEKKTTGGRNGYGAKLANIFSVEFIIETADGRRGKRYKQVFSSNMTQKSDPVISTCKSSENWTKVTFKPDFPKFNMTHLESDVVALMSKRVVDIAGCLGKTVKVELNGQRLLVKSFSDYVNLYLASAEAEEPPPRIYERVNDRWEVCVTLSDGQFQQVSFVNSIATIKGGTHVQYVSDQIVAHVMSLVQKKNKNAGVKNFQIRNHLWVFVNALIDNPAFDSQTKETLTTRQGSFGSKCELSQKFLKDVTKSGVVESVLTWADIKQSKELKKNDGAKLQRLSGIAKLDDANDAGGRNSEKCTLILTEGDSAKALAMAGISVVGRNSYGVFPLRGKLLNVREATHKQIMENAEINSIKRILGLQHGKDYESTKALRYGHLMIMTDQDHDGSHIKGLLINFIHTFWPSLLKVPSFLVEFITPIVKATHRNNRVLSFYTLPEYELWKKSLNGETRGWTIKYYKGLGTSTAKEGKEYFRDLDRHKKEFQWSTDQDSDAIEMAFSKKKVEARKNWLRQFEPGTYLDQNVRAIKYSDFINKELILFSMADLSRSIPSMVDGLKPGQRKILFCSFKRKFYKQSKVAQFSGYVSDISAYHHGEQNLGTTIVGMAQNFVGSNNINLLSPVGQFGTRNQGGKDAASARYIFTCLAPLTRYLFPEADDILLNYLKEDGQSIEPSWYAPIIPMVLVNGSEGIGTGWSSFVPNYNPRDIVANIKRLLYEKPMEPMEPWYKGFKGTVERSATKESGVSYLVTGIIEAVNDTTLKISELPVRKWTQDYKEYLESLMVGTEKNKEAFIEDYREHNTDTRVHFEVSLSAENMALAIQEGLAKKFKLTTTMSTSNMHLFNEHGIIQKYESPEHILEAFFHIRLELYVKRKAVLMKNLQLDHLRLSNKVRFITEVVKGEIIVSNRKRADLLQELKRKQFTPFPKKAKSDEPAVAGAETQDDDGEAAADSEELRAGDYEYLLSMPIGTLTWEKVQELIQQQKNMEDEIQELGKSTAKSLWEKDLNMFIEQLDAQELEEAKEEEYETKHMAKEGAATFKKRVVKKDTKSKKSELKLEALPDSKPESAAVGKKTAATGAKSKGAPKPTAGKRLPDIDSEDEVPSLRARLSAYSKQAPQGPVSGPDVSARAEAQQPFPKTSDLSKEVDYGSDSLADVVPSTGEAVQVNEDDPEDKSPVKVAAKRQAGGRSRKPVVGLSDSEDDFDPEKGLRPAANKGRKKAVLKEVSIPKAGAAASGRTRPPVTVEGTKKRGKKAAVPVTDLSSDEEAVNAEEEQPKAPQLKVRKIRISPFNKKSASLTKDMPKPAPILRVDESVAESRPRRSTRAHVQVIDLEDSDDADEARSSSSEDELFDSEED